MQSNFLITPEIVLDWDCCYAYRKEDVLQKLLGNGKTALEICNLKIPAEDRLWALLHNPIFDDRELRLLACYFAETALARVKNPDERSTNAIAVARRYANDEATTDELRATRDSAWSDADIITKGAVKYAMWAVASAVALASTNTTGWNAARDAARVGMNDIEVHANVMKFVIHLSEVLNGTEILK